MNVKPVSDEAKQAVWVAYASLDEKHKRAIAKHTAKASPKLFRYWVKVADLVRGFDQRRVAGREGLCATRLDKALKEVEDGGLAADVIAKFLMNTGIVDEFLEGIPDDAERAVFERWVDEKAAKSKSEFAGLAAACVKCYPPKSGRSATPAETANSELMGLVTRLDEHAVKLEGWAGTLRLTGNLPKDDIIATVTAANEDAVRLSELMRGHRDTTGCPEREFKTPADVAAHVKELCDALATHGEKDAIASFLRGLAGALRALKVTHRSTAERARLSTLRDQAAGEVENAAGADDPKWTADDGKSGTEWLRWAFEIGDEKLTETQGHLKGDGYGTLSEFIGVGEAEWICEEQSNETDGAKPTQTPIANTVEHPPATEVAGETVQQAERESGSVAAPAIDIPKPSATVDAEPGVMPEPHDPKTTITEEKSKPVARPKTVQAPVAAGKAASEGRAPVNVADASAGVDGQVPIRDDRAVPCDATAKVSAWDGKDIREVAKAVAGPWENVPVAPIAALAGKLAAGGEYALAYHLVLNAAELGELRGVIPAWVYGAVACGSSMQTTDQSAIGVLQGFFQQDHEKIFEDLEGADRVAARLLLAAGALEPALFSPITGASTILQTLHLHKTTAFQALVSGVAEYGTRGVGLPRAALFSTISADELKRRLEGVQAKAREWLIERAPQFEIISRPGKDTWRAWISKTGPVGRLLGPVVAGRAEAIPELQALTKQYSSASVVDQEVRHLYRNELSHRGELLRPALNMIRRHTEEAIEIVDEWISVLESQPNTRQGYDQKVLTALRKCFADHAKDARVELASMNNETCPPAVRAGAAACLRVVDDIMRVLEGKGTDTGTANPRNAHRLLHDDLSRVTGLPLDGNGAPRLQDYAIPTEIDEAVKFLAGLVVRGIGTAVAEGLPTFVAAVKARGEAGDHESTGYILKVLEGSETPDGLKRLEQDRAQSITRHREACQKKLKHGQRALSDALTKGLYATQEYERWAVRLESAERDMRASGFLRFGDVHAVCARLIAELSERKTTEIARMRLEIDRVKPSSEQRTRLETVLAAGDVHTATDYLDRIRNQIGLPDVLEAETAPFMRFFGKEDESACELIDRELREMSGVSDFVARVAKRGHVSGLQLGEMQTVQAKEAADFLQLWFSVKTARELTESSASRIFGFFGMRPGRMVKASDAKKSGHQGEVWDLHVDPLESRGLCPSASFGSDARGHYRVAGYWRRPAAEDILQNARELGGNPVIVLYFGRMSVAERRNLAAEQGRGDVIVIDDVLAVFLAGQRKGRLLSLFLCSLPFAHISPYTKAASLLPPEMFYGREREIRQLISAGTDSSCLLYGGRQIGKTVLLRHVQRLFERQASGLNVATYIDLKGKEIGTNRAMDEVWLVIAEELAKRKVIVEPVGRQTKHEWLFARIEEWLAGDAKRRILVLLDEADAFLAADAVGQNAKAPFSACTVLKDLMERTNRRFKLVFAGLHNVQKSTKVSNNPLAHFGEPICIGAMTTAGEASEAEALITEPLGTAGYFFESPDLSARILAQTNYYPNLIQIYCDELLKYMQQRSRVLFDPNKTPPYIIGAKILEDVYEQHELREELRLRFKWTLELDRRFEVIANILALNDVDCTRGLDVAEISQHAQLYWDKGFSAKDGTPLTYEGFRDLLEEMVGLGILRRSEPPDHYALRNPNVLNLIGSRSVVSRLLEDAHKWPSVDVYDPTKFRGQISEQDKALRSPLTAAQEAKFKTGENRVCIVCGCNAGHVDKVDEAIGYRFGRDGYVRVLSGHENLSDFQAELTNLGNRKSEGTTLIVVPDNVRWDRNWIAEATKRVTRFVKAKGSVGVIFVAGPAHVLTIVPEIVRRKYEGVEFVSIEPWDDSTVNQWLQEAGHSAVDAGSRASLMEVTGNWPVLLKEAAALLNSSTDDADGLKRKVKEAIFRPDRKQELRNLFGLVDPTMAPLQFLNENGPGWSPEDISALHGDGDGHISVEHVNNVLTWAELIGLARRGPEGWSLDPGVRQVLSIG